MRSAYLELLRDVEPPVKPDSQWAAVAAQIAQDPRSEGLTEEEQQGLFKDYVDELAALEMNRQQRSEEIFKVSTFLKLHSGLSVLE